MTFALCASLSLLVAAPASARVDICYAGGANLPNFKLNGNSALDGTDLVLTQAIGAQASSIGYNTPLSTAGDIHIQMRLRISQNGNGGADGMTFVMHNDPMAASALGGVGWGIGYAGITKSVAVEFDTYHNGDLNDPDANHIGIQKNGDATHYGANSLTAPVAPGINLKGGTPFWVWIDYTGVNKVMQVYLSTGTTKPSLPLLTATVDVPTIVGAQMYLSFTASTGGSWSKHEIMDLLASDAGTPGTACCDTDNQCASNALGPICDPVKRTCGPCSLSDTTDCGGSNHACNLSGGINTCTSACTGNFGSGGANPCTSASFPKCSTSGGTSGSCVACDGDYTKAGASYACLAAAPTCLLNGVCGRCTSNLDCGGTLHLGSICNTSTGVCGACSSNAQCQSEYGGGATCSGGLCQGAQNGTPCQSGALCASNTCSSTGFCVPSSNGCFYDRECDEQSYCARGTYTCVPKRASGAAIPSDGLHAGVCDVTTAAAVCVTGLCNATTNTCSALNGALCTSANQCVTNFCSADGKCGCSLDSECSAKYCAFGTRTCTTLLASGVAIPSDGLHDGACSESTALVCATSACNETLDVCALVNADVCSLSSQCASNTCTSGHCVPAANGCFLDTDCGDGNYCDRSTLSCTAKRQPGEPLPNDGLHTGVCNATTAAACTSGLCNATTKTCATGNGTTCSADAECTNDTCTSNHCVPASNGCYEDSDCGALAYCHRATLLCTDLQDAGTVIPDDGLHDGTCTEQNAEATCLSGHCNPATHTCARLDGGACTTDNQCTNDTCTSEHCVPAAGGCYLDLDCTSGSDYCDRSAFMCTPKRDPGATIPNDGLHDGTCTVANAVACASGLCNTSTHTCALVQGGACTVDGGCVSNKCTSEHCVPASGGCYLDGDCATSDYCARNTLLCHTKLSAGSPLPNDGLHGGVCTSDAASALCTSGACNATTNTCARAQGAVCEEADECVSNACTSSHCVAATNGCYLDSDCAPGNFCARGSFTCVAQLGAGSSIPSDGLHTGICSNASAVCASGACNEATKTCALADRSECTASAQCTSNTCVSDHCVPALNGCYLDGNCGAAEFCDRATLHCASRLAAGASIPSDGLHDGLCSVANASAVCASLSCNASANTCALGNGNACLLAKECVSTVCTSNHCVPPVGGCYLDGDCADGNYCDRSALLCKPLLPAGAALPSDDLHDGTCTALNAASVCASGLCNPSSLTCAADLRSACTQASECQSNVCASAHCVPSSGGCYLDGNCPAGSYCEQASLLCRAKLALGAQIPNDGLRDGSCSPEHAAAVCTSMACNPVRNTCGTALGSTCSDDDECVSDACTSGHCVQSAGGCYIDLDCGADTYCDRSTFACVPKLVLGSRAPNDGLHAGDCDAAAAACASGLCNPTTKTCAAPEGSSCSSATQCTSNACASRYCVSSTSGCAMDSDCESGSYCDRGTFACKKSLAAGEPIPSDELHDGTCSDENAAALCADGACNAETNTCAGKASVACSAASQCENGRCSDNGFCGLSAGQSGCTQANAAFICQTGFCSPGGVCSERTQVSVENTSRGGCSCSSRSGDADHSGALTFFALAFFALRRRVGRSLRALR